MHVRWQGEDRTLLPLVQAGAYLGVHWRVVEARDEEVVHLDHVVQVADGTCRVVEVCKVRVVGGDHGVQEGALAHGVRGQVSP